MSFFSPQLSAQPINLPRLPVRYIDESIICELYPRVIWLRKFPSVWTRNFHVFLENEKLPNFYSVWCNIMENHFENANEVPSNFVVLF